MLQKCNQSAVCDDIDALAEKKLELESLVESLDKTCTRYKMEISAEKSKSKQHQWQRGTGQGKRCRCWVQASSTSEQLCQIMAQSQRPSRGLRK